MHVVTGAGRTDRCPNQPKRRYTRRKHQNIITSPSTLCCATLFFAYIFSPSSNSSVPRRRIFKFLTHPASCRFSTTAIIDGGMYHYLPHILAVHAFSYTPRATTSHSKSHQTRILTTQLSRVASSETAVTTRGELEKMTVKQLKSYIEDNAMQIPKGQSSNLKLKKQIVDFIWNYQNDTNGSQIDGAKPDDDDMGVDAIINGANGDVVDGDSAAAVPPPTKNKKGNNKLWSGTGMPPLPTTTERVAAIMAADDEVDEEKDDSGDSSSATPYVLTPKDRIVLDVLNRYPPLHDAIVDSCAANDNIDNLPLEGITTSNIEQCDLSSLNYVVPVGIGEDDVRQNFHPIVANITQSDMDVVFIGTASCTPGVTRGVSCTALRLNWRSRRSYDQNNKQQQRESSLDQKKKEGTYVEERGPTGGTWLFDCGESTQLSIQRTTSIKPGKISKIFITHCHGDHSFGLPGLLCLMGTDRDRDSPPVDIYGPEGLRMWLRVAIRYSVSRVVPPYRVHELMDVPMAPEWEEGHRRNGRFYFQLRKDRDNGREGNTNGGGRRWGMQGLAGGDPVSWISRAPMINLEPSKDFGEMEGGRDIYPQYDHPKSTDGAPIWTVESEDDVTVSAAPMSHGVPCVGYVVQEHNRPGRLRPENVQPLIERNYDGLVKAGIKNPMKVMALVKNLPVGGSYTFPDGTVLRQEDVVKPPRKGRKIVICGDTADCRALEGLGQDADVLIHEATNTFLPGVDKDGNLRLVTRDAKIHGHSTPFMVRSVLVYVLFFILLLFFLITRTIPPLGWRILKAHKCEETLSESLQRSLQGRPVDRKHDYHDEDGAPGHEG